jgi:hypothetical protein
MMGFVLFLVAVILYLPLTAINLVAVMYQYGAKKHVVNDYFYQTAIDIDRFGNHNFRTLLNLTLRKNNGYAFGNINETISSALGKNKQMGTLTLTGKALCKTLHFFDRNHCEKSVGITTINCNKKNINHATSQILQKHIWKHHRG